MKPLSARANECQRAEAVIVPQDWKKSRNEITAHSVLLGQVSQYVTFANEVVVCGDDRATFRTDPELRNEQLENLLVASCSCEAEQLEKLCGKKKEVPLPKSKGRYKSKVEGSG